MKRPFSAEVVDCTGLLPVAVAPFDCLAPIQICLQMAHTVQIFSLPEQSSGRAVALLSASELASASALAKF